MMKIYSIYISQNHSTPSIDEIMVKIEFVEYTLIFNKMFKMFKMLKVGYFEVSGKSRISW